MDVEHNNSISDQTPAVSPHADNPPQSGSNASSPYRTGSQLQKQPSPPSTPLPKPGARTDLPASVSPVAPHPELATPQYVMESTHKQATRIGVFARLFGGESKTTTRIRIKNVRNAPASNGASKPGRAQQVLDLLVVGAPVALKYLQLLTASETMDLYVQVAGDLKTLIQLCGTIQQVLKTGSESSIVSLQMAFVSFENLTASVNKTLRDSVAQMLQTNPGMPIVTPASMPASPQATRGRLRSLNADERRKLAGSMTATVEFASNNLKRIQENLRSSRQVTLDSPRLPVLNDGMRDGDLYLLADAIKQAYVLAVELDKKQTEFTKQLFEAPDAGGGWFGIFRRKGK